MTDRSPAPRRTRSRRRVPALVLLLGLAGWPAASALVPPAQQSSARSPEHLLVVKPNAGEPGTTLVIQGGPFGPKRGRLKLVLAEPDSAAHTQPRQVELQILQWGPKEVRARIPALPWRQGGRFAILLLDERKGTRLARSGADFTLGTPRSRDPGDDERASSRLEHAEPPPDPKAERSDPKDVRLLASPGRIGPGEAFTVTGTDFGDRAKGRGLYLQVQESSGRRVRVPLVVEGWARRALAVRAAEKLPAQRGPADLLLVDEQGRVIGRGGLVLLDTGRSGKTSGPEPDDSRSERRTAAGEADGRRQEDPEAGQAGGATSAGRGGDRGRRPNGGRPDPSGRPEGPGPESELDPGAGQGLEDRPTDARALPDHRPGGSNPQPGDADRRRLPFRPALALGGGGAKGAFQVGVLQNLYARGLSPVIITGTSVGALNAAKLAEGGQAIDDVVRVWREITGNESIYVQNPHLTRLIGQETRDVCGDVRAEQVDSAKGWFTPLFRLSLDDAEQVLKVPEVPQKLNELLMDVNALDGFYVQRGLATRVAGNLSTDAVARSGIKLRLTATERRSGDLRYFTENGDIELLDGAVWQRGRTDGADLHENLLKAPTVADGVMASSAIPLFFAPWHIRGGEAYWDGAVREGIPIHKALELGATDLIAILTSPRETLTTGRPSKYTLTIERVRRVGDANPDDGSSGDYYARVKWGHHPWRRTNYYENDRNVAPNWRFEDVFGEILVEIKDYDSPDADDVCDASPAHGDNRDESWEDPRLLKIDFDPRRFTDAQNPGRFPILGDGRGQIGDLVTVAGQGERDRVEVSFRIRPGTSSSSGYTKGLPADLAPLSQAMDLLTHQGSEVSATDLSDLGLLDVLHEVAGELGEGTVVRSVRSFPLPKDLSGRAYMVPNYVLIEPPFTMGDLQEFDPEAISFNIELGETVARWTRVDFLDRLATRYDADGVTPIPTQRPGLSDGSLEQWKRSAVMGLITSRIDTWRAREADAGAAGGLARCWREKYEQLQAKANDLQIRPPRRSPRPAP